MWSPVSTKLARNFQNRWQDTKVDVEHLLTQSEEFCIQQVSLSLVGLATPHVMKFMERVTSGSLLFWCSIQDVRVGTAHVLQFLHERHVMPTNLKLQRLFPTEKNHKITLHCGVLLSPPVKSPIKKLKKQQTPTSLEWGLIKQICAEDHDTSDDVSYVMSQLHHEQDKASHSPLRNRKVHKSQQHGTGIVNYTELFVDPEFNLTVKLLFQDITDQLREDENISTLMDGYVFDRLMSVHQQLLGTICAKELIHSFMKILARFKSSLVHRADNSVLSFCVKSFPSVEHSSLSFHGEIDALVARCSFTKTATTSIHDWIQHCNFLRLNQQESFQLALDKLGDELVDDEEKLLTDIQKLYD
ncbi:LOW QUALITY PROTEIN: TKL protein kinase [Phytophthora megakarya]|uniref:TKL protein kinase n=1 Tax=Phytophthora megakarya TaxID=4795 RepID=A0A225WR18_9STRA|nr:LOW QUALITY PROTEIN: TKL protein kinase [Phytophthora megakarya]